MPKEPSGGSEAFPCISNQALIFSHFLTKLWAPARRAEKMWIQSSSKPSSALISEQKHSDPPSYFVLFTFEASHESQLQSRTG